MTLAQAAQIRPAIGGEQRACRMLLPELVGAAWEEPWVVAIEAPYQFLAAVAWMPVRYSDGRPMLQLIFRVAPPFRGQGLGDLILDHLLNLARQRQMGGLLHYLKGQDSAEIRPWLEARGFTALSEELVFDAPLALFHGQVQRLLNWLRARNCVPDGAQVVPLSQGLLDPVSLLHGELIGGEPWAVRRRLEAQLLGPFANHLFVLMVGGVAQGLLLCQPLEGKMGTAVISAKAVAPALQASQSGLAWADLLLMGEGLAVACSLGHQRLRFSCLEGNRHTLGLARRAQGEEIDRIVVLERGLA